MPRLLPILWRRVQNNGPPRNNRRAYRRRALRYRAFPAIHLIIRGLDMERFPTIFSTDSAKAIKASAYGYLNAIHYMAPHSSAGVGNLCSHASVQCIAMCLGTHSGQAAMVSDLEHGTNATRESRKLKARLFMKGRAAYMNEMARAIMRIAIKARRNNLTPCIRLNGSTDIAWERVRFDLEPSTIAKLAPMTGKLRRTNGVTLPELFHWIQFVDYTKNPNRMGKVPANLDLTLSYAVNNSQACVDALMAGHNVAMIFHGGLPESFAGFPVIDGDKHDLRHLDPKGGFIVGLSPKGRTAKRDTSGFVVDWHNGNLESVWRNLVMVAEFERARAA